MATAKPPPSDFSVRMERRRKSLKMSRPVLARRSGVSLPTVNRILSGGDERATYASLRAIARALGMDFELKSIASEQDLAEQEAHAKAEEIVRMVQGTSALESQAVGRETYIQMIRQTVHELMAGPRRRLWSPK